MFFILHIHIIVIYFGANFTVMDYINFTLVTHAQVLNTHKGAYKYNVYLNEWMRLI